MASSVGRMRFMKQMEVSISSLKRFGFNDEQIHEVTSIFTETDFYLLFLTFVVALFHVSVLFVCLYIYFAVFT